MKLDLFRTVKTDGYISGNLAVNGIHECWTLENPDHLNPALGPDHIAIPCGTFGVIIYFSPHFQRKVLLLVGVPARTSIEVHIGCFVKDSKGCILVGQVKSYDTLGQSTPALEALVEKVEAAIAAGETVDITIQEVA